MKTSPHLSINLPARISAALCGVLILGAVSSLPAKTANRPIPNPLELTAGALERTAQGKKPRVRARTTDQVIPFDEGVTVKPAHSSAPITQNPDAKSLGDLFTLLPNGRILLGGSPAPNTIEAAALGAAVGADVNEVLNAPCYREDRPQAIRNQLLAAVRCNNTNADVQLARRWSEELRLAKSPFNQEAILQRECPRFQALLERARAYTNAAFILFFRELPYDIPKQSFILRTGLLGSESRGFETSMDAHFAAGPGGLGVRSQPEWGKVGVSKIEVASDRAREMLDRVDRGIHQKEWDAKRERPTLLFAAYAEGKLTGDSECLFAIERIEFFSVEGLKVAGPRGGLTPPMATRIEKLKSFEIAAEPVFR